MELGDARPGGCTVGEMNTERIAEIAKRAFNPPSHYAYAAGLADIDFLLAALQVRDEEIAAWREIARASVALADDALATPGNWTVETLANGTSVALRVLLTRGTTEGAET